MYITEEDTMHLMSFYAAPNSTRRAQENAFYKTVFSWKPLWFVAGVACGCAVVLSMNHTAPSLPSQNVPAELSLGNGSDALSQEDKIAQLLSQHQNQPTVAVSPEAGMDGSPLDAAQATPATSLKTPVPTWPLRVDVTIASGDTLIDILVRQGIERVAAHRLAKQVNGVYNLRRLRPGHNLTITLVEDTARRSEGGLIPTKLHYMELFVSDVETLHVEAKGGDTYSIKMQKKQLLTEPVRAKSIIVGSFYQTVAEHGLPKESIHELIKNFSYEIDFQRDIRAGDVVDVMYETKKTQDGKVVSTGDVLYAMLKSKGKTLTHYRYADNFGVTRFFNEKGESIVKRLLKTPIDGARISSRFGMRRHPILGYSKMHQGVDFAASTGTPIYAAGDGVVHFAGYAGGYGKMVEIKHNGTYSTAYAHASRIHPTVRKGMRVRQGQVIAYVGSTGNSTGAHLHYEIRRYGRQVNPLHVQFASSTEKLQGKQLIAFKEHIRKVHQQLAQMKTDGLDQEEVALVK